MVHAAGGAVVSVRGEAGEATILVIHRPRYDDWSLPKGKCHRDEAESDCALREVEEETGVRCTLGPRLSEIAYRDQKGRPKSVAYFLMEPAGERAPADAFTANDEVDELRWATLAEAQELLTYKRDVEVARLALARAVTPPG